MNQPWEFEEPGKDGDRFTAEDAQNRRLIVVPIGYVPSIRTARGDEVDAIKLNIVDLDNPGGSGPNVYWGTLWFGGRLIRNFKPKIGKMFLGYVAKQATGGGFRAWVFTSLVQDPQTVGMAQQFLQAHPEFMETCMGDVAVEQAAAQSEVRQQQQQWQPAGNGMDPRSTFSPPAPQQWQGRGPMPPRVDAPSPPPPAPPQFPQPVPVQQGPAPLPPQTAEDPWPASPGQFNGGQGNGQASGPPAQAPSSPAPVGGGQSVMDRLRAQRDQGQAGPAQGENPF